MMENIAGGLVMTDLIIFITLTTLGAFAWIGIRELLVFIEEINIKTNKFDYQVRWKESFLELKPLSILRLIIITPIYIVIWIINKLMYIAVPFMLIEEKTQSILQKLKWRIVRKKE